MAAPAAEPVSAITAAMDAASIGDAKEVEFKPEQVMDAVSLSKASAIAAVSEAATFSSLGLYEAHIVLCPPALHCADCENLCLLFFCVCVFATRPPFLLSSIQSLNYTTPSEIQALAIPAMIGYATFCTILFLTL
jgi:hypothetical protein